MFENIQEIAKSVLNIAEMKKQYQAAQEDLTGEWLTKNHIHVLEITEEFPEANIVSLGDIGVSIVVNKLTDGSIGIGYFTNEDYQYDEDENADNEDL